MNEIDGIARREGRPTAFYLGKLQDALALDPLTAYSTVLVPFFAQHPFARLTLLTKSTSIERLLGLDHCGHTILSWSVNPPEVCALFEENVPDIEERLEAMRRLASAGYPVRAVMMPIIPVEGWETIYNGFPKHLIETVPLARLTLGGICIYQGAQQLMERKTGWDNVVSANIDSDSRMTGDGRARYSKTLRGRIYNTIIEETRRTRPKLELALCLEDRELWHAAGLEENIGRCNCVLQKANRALCREDRYTEKLAWFKQNEKPEAVLLVADNPVRVKIVVAWTNAEVRRRAKPTPLRGKSENEVWEWLWENAEYSRTELVEKIGISFSESSLEGKMRPLIGNRILYPDGTVNSFVQRYLREQVLGLFQTKPKRTTKG